MRRLVIALPYYDGDREKCFRLARFIKDLEPKFRDDVELCFVARHDSMPIHPGEMMDFVTTFKISWYLTETKASGHPAGCNAMATDIFREALRRSLGDWQDVDAILFMEPDCVPCARDWINQLRAEWDYYAPMKPLVVGCRRSENVDVPHVNGNALWSPKLAAKIDVGIDCHGFGWDSAWAEQIGRDQINTPLIVNLFKETNVPEARMRTNPFYNLSRPRPPVLIHGVKDESAWDFAMKALAV